MAHRLDDSHTYCLRTKGIYRNTIMKNKYNWKKTVQKGLKSLGIVFITGLIVVWQEDPRFLVLVPLAEMTLNWMKHK